MSKEKTLTILVILLVAMNLFIIGFMLMVPHPGPDGPMEQKDDKDERIRHAFHFDENQMSLYRKSKDAVREAIEPAYDELQKSSMAYYLSNEADTLLRSQLLMKIDSVSHLIYSIQLKHFDEIKRISKPGQADALEDLVRDIMNRPKHKKPR